MFKHPIESILNINIDFLKIKNSNKDSYDVYIEPEIWLALAIRHKKLPAEEVEFCRLLEVWACYCEDLKSTPDSKIISLASMILCDNKLLYIDSEIISILERANKYLSYILSTFEFEKKYLHMDELYMRSFKLEYCSFYRRKAKLAQWSFNLVEDNALLNLKVNALKFDLMEYKEKYSKYKPYHEGNYRLDESLENCLKLM